MLLDTLYRLAETYFLDEDKVLAFTANRPKMSQTGEKSLNTNCLRGVISSPILQHHLSITPYCDAAASYCPPPQNKNIAGPLCSYSKRQATQLIVCYLCSVGRSSASCSGSLVFGITPIMVLFSEVPFNSRWLTKCMFRGESTLNLTVEPGRSTPSWVRSKGRRLGI